MSPNTIYLHTDVCMNMGPLLLIQTPHIHSKMLHCDSVSQPKKNAVIVRYGWDKKKSRTETTVGGLGFMGPRDKNSRCSGHTPFPQVHRHYSEWLHSRHFSFWKRSDDKKDNVVCWKWKRYCSAYRESDSNRVAATDDWDAYCTLNQPPRAAGLVAESDFSIRRCNQGRKSIKPGCNQQERICLFFGQN